MNPARVRFGDPPWDVNYRSLNWVYDLHQNPGKNNLLARFFETLGNYWESLPTLPYQLVLSMGMSAASSYVGEGRLCQPDSLGPSWTGDDGGLPSSRTLGSGKNLGKFSRISTHTIHGTGIFTYMKTIKIDQM